MEMTASIGKRDHARGWVVMVASFVCFMFVFGMIVSFGVYFVVLLEFFRCSQTEAALVGSVAYGSLSLSGPLASLLYRRYGSRITVMSGGLIATLGYLLSYAAPTIYQLAATQGFVGFGFGICITSLLSVQTEYFDKYLFFAIGFVTVGSACGNFIFQPIFYAVITEYTWRGSMLINAGLALQVVVCGALLAPRKEFRHFPKPKLHQLCEVSLFKDKRYIFLCADGLLWGGSNYIFFAMINKLMIEHGVPRSTVSYIVALSGAGNMCGRTLAALCCHSPRTNRVLLYFCATAMMSSQHFTLTFCQSEMCFAMSCAMFGFSFGLMLATMAPVIIQIFGVPKLAAAQGFVGFSVGLGGLIVPIAAGELADYFHLEVSFYFGGSLCAGAALCCFILVILQHRHNKSQLLTGDQQALDPLSSDANTHTVLNLSDKEKSHLAEKKIRDQIVASTLSLDSIPFT